MDQIPGCWLRMRTVLHGAADCPHFVFTNYSFGFVIGVVEVSARKADTLDCCHADEGGISNPSH